MPWDGRPSMGVGEDNVLCNVSQQQGAFAWVGRAGIRQVFLASALSRRRPSTIPARRDGIFVATGAITVSYLAKRWSRILFLTGQAPPPRGEVSFLRP